jgi:nucleoside-diphosphate-sugar epimerase
MTSLGSVLFLGGNGIISAAASRLAVKRGFDVTLLNRGVTTTRPPIEGAASIRGDAADVDSLRAAVDGRQFDVVIDFQLFNGPEAAERVKTFDGRTGQYIFISSGAAYQKPVQSIPITESTPLSNFAWPYANGKIDAESVLLDAFRTSGFPVTIVRPSHTYDETLVPLIGGWTMIDRMRRGKPALVHGDGTTFWTLTSSEDVAVGIVGLFRNLAALGTAVHITTEESHAWDFIAKEFGRAAGVDASIVHATSEAIARALPEWEEPILGDWRYTEVFDNQKIASLVPDFKPLVPLWLGARRIVEWYDAQPSRRVVDDELDARVDELIANSR